MAARLAQLYKYIRLEGGWKYCRAVFYDNNKIKAHAVITPTGEQTIKHGYYCLSFNRRWQSVGNDPTEAVRLLMLKRAELQTIAAGGSVVKNEAQPKVSGTLASAFDSWIQDFIDGDKHIDTISAKRLVATEFQRACKAKSLAAVTRQDCLRYLTTWLKKRGNEDRTRFNKFLHLRQCLQFHGLQLLTKKDAPKYEVEDPIALENDELEIFWRFCPNHKRLLYTVLYQTGLRLQEIQTLRWSDILGGVEPHIKVQSRPEYKYVPKAHHCRSVPVQDELYALLMRAKMLSKSPLVFTTRTGRHLTHLWDDTQAVFKKAGLDMAKGHPHCFRATYCTTLLRQNVPLSDVMQLMGHRDLASTMRYSAALRKAELHQRVAQVKFT